MLYGITINRPGNDGQVPMFFLDERVQGITSTTHAEVLAACIVMGFRGYKYLGKGEAGTGHYQDDRGRDVFISAVKMFDTPSRDETYCFS